MAESKLQKAAAAIKAQGLEQFILCVKAGPVVSIHFEQMPLQQAMEILIAGFHQVIQIDLEKNPNYSKERKQIYVDLAHDFDAMVRSSNDRFLKQNQIEAKAAKK